VGAFIKAEFVSAADGRQSQRCVRDLAHARGFVAYAPAAEDDLLTAFLCGPVPAITQVATGTLSRTTDSTVGPDLYRTIRALGDSCGIPRALPPDQVSPAASACGYRSGPDGGVRWSP